MKRYFLFLFIILSLILSACSSKPTVSENQSLSDLYIVALEQMMKKDEGLNGDMEFIAIDMSNFKNISDTEKEIILDYFEKNYSIKTMDSTFEKLNEDGYFDEETLSLRGVLLRFDVFNIHEKRATLEGSKYRSGLGAIGLTIRLENKNNVWKATESKMTWIS